MFSLINSIFKDEAIWKNLSEFNIFSLKNCLQTNSFCFVGSSVISSDPPFTELHWHVIDSQRSLKFVVWYQDLTYLYWCISLWKLIIFKWGFSAILTCAYTYFQQKKDWVIVRIEEFQARNTTISST